MHDVFSSIRSLLKVDSTSIDNFVFRLHYKATMFVLVAGSLLVTQRQYFGDPIDCIVDKIDPGIMDTFCWIHSTYTIPALTHHGVQDHVPHPGVGTNVDPSTGQAHEQKHHKYYQWVTFFLYLQALFFYVPRYLWKQWEGGKVKMLVSQLDSPIVDDAAKKERKDLMIEYFTLNLNRHNMYAFRFFLCEILNFVNVIGQIFFTNRFLGYEFTTYGTRVLQFTGQELGTRYDPMDYIFPKVAKCTFKKFGSSGSHEIHDGICVLPLNIFSEKIFIFLWFWYIIVATITAVALMYRIATIAAPQLRKLALRARSKLAHSAAVDLVVSKCKIGDWFLLTLIAKNMDPLIYKEFIGDLAVKIQEKNRQTQ